MKTIIFGATGMVGLGVLRECLNATDVDAVLTIGRSATGSASPKLRELIHKDFTNFSGIADQLVGYDACFFCLGVSSFGMSEEEYRRLTYDIALAAARTLSECNPQMTFIYVSGVGTDSSEKGRTMWGRVKGKTENDILKLPFKAAYMFRPGAIQALHGIRPKAKSTRIAYALLGFLFPLARALFPRHVVTTEQIGVAMLKAVRHGAPKRVLEPPDIVALAA